MKRNQDPINRFIWERRKREKDMKEEVNRKEKIKPWEKRREKNPNKEMNEKSTANVSRLVQTVHQFLLDISSDSSQQRI